MGNDLISKCKLFNALAPVQTLGEAYGVIQGMETEDAEYVRRGYWKTVEDWDGDEHYQCSVCGAEFVLIDGSPEDNDYLFCPHCGAKVDRGEGEDKNVGDDTVR